jgi:hypothetical protein
VISVHVHQPGQALSQFAGTIVDLAGNASRAVCVVVLAWYNRSLIFGRARHALRSCLVCDKRVSSRAAV